MSHPEHSTAPGTREDFFENVIAGHLILDRERNVVRANAVIARWLGMSVEELCGQPVSSLFPVSGRIYLETHVFPLLALKGSFEEISVDLRDREGNRISVLANGSECRDAEGNPSFFYLSFYRAAERLAYEQDLRVSRNDARQALLDERETSVLREQFIAVLGHDLRNPLGGILMASHLLAENPEGEMRDTLLELVRDSAERMQRLIDDVMDFARGRLGGGMSMDFREIGLQEFITGIVGNFRSVHPGREILMDLDIPVTASCDPDKISRLVTNLLSNAVHHGSRKDPVRIVGKVSGDAVDLSVRNTGDPIPEELLPKLFHPFTRQKARAGKDGIGLGLFISSEIAKGHGGSIVVESDEEETRFTFSMPLR